MVDESTALAPRHEEALPARYEPLSREDIEILKQTVCSELSDGQLAFFLRVCQARRLNPLAGQIHAIMRRERQGGEKRLTIQTSIDGFRLIAERTGRYCPGCEPSFAYDKNGQLVSATSYVKKLVAGEWHEVGATARFEEFCQTYEGKPTRMWQTMPHVLLSKCAESQALRRAFPEELMGLYTDDEMAQADNEPHRRAAAERAAVERTAKVTQRPEAAPSYAAATIAPETPEARRERAVALLRGKLGECGARNLWDRDDLDLARWADYDFSAGTAEEIMTDAEALEAVLQIARRAEGYEQEAAAAGGKVCSTCAKALTEGQYTVNLRAYGKPMCPVHQREAKEAARAQ
jgi:phage recombination protein Bet